MANPFPNLTPESPDAPRYRVLMHARIGGQSLPVELGQLTGQQAMALVYALGGSSSEKNATVFEAGHMTIVTGMRHIEAIEAAAHFERKLMHGEPPITATVAVTDEEPSEYCKAIVDAGYRRASGGRATRQCRRKAVCEGWCVPHHPAYPKPARDPHEHL